MFKMYCFMIKKKNIFICTVFLRKCTVFEKIVGSVRFFPKIVRFCTVKIRVADPEPPDPDPPGQFCPIRSRSRRDNFAGAGSGAVEIFIIWIRLR